MSTRLDRRKEFKNERTELSSGVGEFCGNLATKIHQLKAYDPESKGGVERINGYFETSFLPSWKRQCPRWVDGVSRLRHHRR